MSPWWWNCLRTFSKFLSVCAKKLPSWGPSQYLLFFIILWGEASKLKSSQYFQFFVSLYRELQAEAISVFPKFYQFVQRSFQAGGHLTISKFLSICTEKLLSWESSQYFQIFINWCGEASKLGTISIWKCHLPCIGIPMLKIRQPHDHLIMSQWTMS